MISSRMFPFEKRDAERAIRSVDPQTVSGFTLLEIEGEAVNAPDYLAVYDSDTGKFYGISAARYLEGNYESACILEPDGTLEITLREMIRPQFPGYLMWECPKTNLIVSGMDRFLEDHPDCGLQQLMTGRELSTLYQTGYACLYLKYPFCSELIEKGYTDFVLNAVADTFESEELLQIMSDETHFRRMTAPDGILTWLKDSGQDPINWGVYVRGCGDSADFADLDRIASYDLRGMTLTHFFELIEDPDLPYTVSSLVDYLERCRRYQGLEERETVEHLRFYLSEGIEIYAEPDYYPRALVTAFSRVTQILDRLNTAIYRRVLMENFRIGLLCNEKYEYEDDIYTCRRITDEDELKKRYSRNFRGGGIMIREPFMAYLVRTKSYPRETCLMFLGTDGSLQYWFAEHGRISTCERQRFLSPKEKKYISSLSAHIQAVRIRTAEGK